ncbi:transposase [Cucumis melo var. makuwa]|uniref:Transposase n=1 Tax=Cucumis melo var. makuwa TaxID=1194695 RepID=A0A5A7TVT0_CUCMM|nr:transposase [Cucumis melo var. makuwa]
MCRLHEVQRPAVSFGAAVGVCGLRATVGLVQRWLTTVAYELRVRVTLGRRLLVTPQDKTIYFNYLNDEVAESMENVVEQCCRRLFHEYSIARTGTGSKQGCSSTNTTSTQTVSSLDANIDFDSNEIVEEFEEDATTPFEQGSSKIDIYLLEANVKTEGDFDILVSTVASESAFSAGRRVVDSSRCSLTPKIVEALIFTQNWLNLDPIDLQIQHELKEASKFEEGFSVVMKNERSLKTLQILISCHCRLAVPRGCNTEPLLYDIDLRTADWSDRVAHLVMQWLNRRRFTATGPPVEQFDMDRRRTLVQEPDQLEEVPPVIQTQSKHGYINPVIMMSAFGMTYYDSRVGQSSDFGTRYYTSEAGQSPSNFGQQYYDLGSDPSSSYMYGHGRGRGEHNEYLYYEVPVAIPEQLDEQQQQENQEEIQQQRVQS